MAPANKQPNMKKRSRKRKRRVASSSSESASDSSSSESSTAASKPKLPIKRSPVPAESDSPEDSSSTSSDSDSDSASSSSPEPATAPTVSSAKAVAAPRERSPSPSPLLPTTLPPTLGEHETVIRERFRKFWMASVADAFQSDLEEMRKEPGMTKSRLAVLIDSLASGGDVFAPSSSANVDEMEIVLEGDGRR